MALVVGQYYRGNPKQKPEQWDSTSAVQATLFDRLRNKGINPNTLELAVPFWGPYFQDYSKHLIQKKLGSSMSYVDGKVVCGTTYDDANNVINLGDKINPVDNNWPGMTAIISAYWEGSSGYPGILINCPYGDYYGNFSFTYDATSYTDKITWRFGDNATIWTNQDPKVFGQSEHIACGKWSVGSYAYYYVDKTLIEYKSAPNGFRPANYTTYFNGYYRAGWRTTPNRYNFIFLFSTELSENDYYNIYDDPFYFWQPPTFRTYFDLAGGGATINFSLNFTNQSTTPDIRKNMNRAISTTLTNQSATQDIDNYVARALYASLLNQSSIEDIIVSISAIVNLAVSLSNQSTTNTIDTAISRNLVASITNQALTQDADLNITRGLFCDLTNQSSVADISITLAEIINFAASLSNQSATQDVDKIISRNLTAWLNGQSATINISTIIDRLINVAVANPSETNNITIAISGIIALAVGLSNQSATTEIDKFVYRDIAANLTNQSLTEDVAVSLANFIDLVCSISNQSDASDISKTIIRNLAANIQNESSSEEIIQRIIRELNVDLIGQSLTPDDITVILGALLIAASDILGIEITNELTGITIN